LNWESALFKKHRRDTFQKKKKRKMKKTFFKYLAKINQKFLPSFTKKKVDLEKASKLQMAIFAYKLWVTKNALD